MKLHRILFWLFVVLATWPAQAAKICIDPGHGGSDPGAVGCGLLEKDVNLDTGLRLRDLLDADDNFTVIMTRSSDVYVALLSRSSYANSNNADRFVSIHSNAAASDSATGIETYCARNPSSTTRDMRDKIQQEMVAAWPLADRGGKEADFSVLVNTSMPASLTELAFINNCAVDATYLGSATHRQEAARAHFDALLRHYGIAPVTTGDLLGVVYEAGDTSLRIPGATVTVVETGDTAIASSPTASWELTLVPGAYTVTASANGFQDNQRSCTVTAGTQTWCSIGLSPNATGVVKGAAYEDEGDGDTYPRLPGATVTALETGDSATARDGDGIWELELPAGTYTLEATLSGYQTSQRSCTVSAGSTVWCSIGLVSGAQWIATHVLGARAAVETSHAGCAAGGGSGAAALAVLLLLVGWRRRLRHLAAIAWLFVLGAACTPAETTGANEPTAVTPFATLVATQQIADAGYMAPVISPSGEWVAMSGPELHGLYVAGIDSRAVRQVSARHRAGYLPVWTPDSTGLALRAPSREFSRQPLELRDLTGELRGPFVARTELRPIQRDDQIWLWTPAGERPVASGDDRYFAPVLSPDGQWLVFNGLETGLYLYRIADETVVRLGAGHHPAFSGDSRWLVYVRAEDDGARITASEVFLTDLSTSRLRTAPVTATPERHELYPSLSADGSRLAFQAGGGIFVAEVRMR